MSALETAVENVTDLISSLESLVIDSKQSTNETKQSDDSLRITPDILNQCIDLREYRDKEKYPYINVLPTTRPSVAFCRFDNEEMKAKQEFIHQHRHGANPQFTNSTELTELCREGMLGNPVQDPVRCQCVEYTQIPNVKCFWIEYEGASIANGLLLVFHGSAYIYDYPQYVFAECELLSKLTGMPCVVVQYRKAPRFVLPAPVADGLAVYEHFVKEMRIPSSDITVIGESSGGGLALLMLHQLALSKQPLPRCAILQSPWCYLNHDAQDTDDIAVIDPKRANYPFDSSLKYVTINIAAKLALGMIDANLKPIKCKLVGAAVDKKSFNPIFHDFKGLKDVSMYFMVGATEALLHDTLDCCAKAFGDGCDDLRCDIEPYMMHNWCCMVGKFPEADHGVVKMAEFILSKRNAKRQLMPTSPYQPDPGQIVSV